MSVCLIRRGLDLIDEDFDTFQSESKSTVKKGNTTRNGLQKVKKKKHLEQPNLRGNNFSLRKVKSAFKNHQRHSSCDLIASNIKALQKVDKTFSLNANADKIKDHHFVKISKKKECSKDQEFIQSQNPDQATVFTDEDFENIKDIF